MSEHSPVVEQTIRAFSGPANARLRRMIRNSLASGIDPRTLRRHVALTALDVAKLQAVYAAWQREERLGAEGRRTTVPYPPPARRDHA